MPVIAVLGAGGWGTALAATLAEKSFPVRLWARRREFAAELTETRENKAYLPGVMIPPAVGISADLERILFGAEMVVLSVPSQVLRGVLSLAVPLLPPHAILVNTAKGLEVDSLLRLSEVMLQELPPAFSSRVAVLSGPSHAEEVARHQPTAVVVAALAPAVAAYVQEVFMGPYLRVYTNPDLVGVELGGALKNVVALAVGMAEGLGLGDNSKAALITRGLAEITRLGIRLGANPHTFAGLTGIGDLVVTCTSRHSRNRRAGIALGRGKALPDVLSEIGMVVEGVATTRAACELANRLGVEMPIARQVNDVLFAGQAPEVGVANLMQREKTAEIEDLFL
ncbi:MAG: NAD(P)H-dependent glycerol-3-phosphate dehydrogenase [Clostridia bacterium]|nr:MAG: NAD(P)H-dependent glycerol-3-phosphate dehydrogenase [Clostridia bacterium]